ncbi:hypothetical protein, conserved [Leishmania tarentolae]|uniref:Uncharacterized protein n=1 Tax=Leishmania tarentolae TaxID=5689 RepID=A0A640KHJ5_LEITA|nr:hypothetical protein, conserved [Leishmania tarentolae]
MNSDAPRFSPTAEASVQSVPLLIVCLHKCAFSAPLTEVRRAFNVIERLLSNRLQHPTEPRYTSFSATSAAWVNSVVPFVYVLRLATWMGCTLTAEGARYVFLENLDGMHALEPSDAEDQQQLRGQQQISDRLDELRCVASVWSTPLTESFADISRRYQDAYKQLLKLFRLAQGFTNREEVWAGHTYCLQLYRLLAWACHTELQQSTTSSQATLHVPRSVCSASWTARAQREFDRFLCESDLAPSSNAQGSSMTRVPSLLGTQHSHRHECEALAACLADDSFRWLLSHASLCELCRLCESAAVETAGIARGGRESNATVVPLVPGFSAAVAARLRQRAQEEQQQRYLSTTGPLYRQLGQEERHCGERVIINIAALLEQISEVTEAQGMVRHDRHEARRLMENFRQDGDLAKLYALEEKYTAELEEAKLLYGKPVVYAALFER